MIQKQKYHQLLNSLVMSILTLALCIGLKGLCLCLTVLSHVKSAGKALILWCKEMLPNSKEKTGSKEVILEQEGSSHFIPLPFQPADRWRLFLICSCQRFSLFINIIMIQRFNQTTAFILLPVLSAAKGASGAEHKICRLEGSPRQLCSAGQGARLHQADGTEEGKEKAIIDMLIIALDLLPFKSKAVLIK